MATRRSRHSPLKWFDKLTMSGVVSHTSTCSECAGPRSLPTPLGALAKRVPHNLGEPLAVYARAIATLAPPLLAALSPRLPFLFLAHEYPYKCVARPKSRSGRAIASESPLVRSAED